MLESDPSHSQFSLWWSTVPPWRQVTRPPRSSHRLCRKIGAIELRKQLQWIGQWEVYKQYICWILDPVWSFFNCFDEFWWCLWKQMQYNIYMRVVLNSFTRKRTSSPNKKFSFAKLSPYSCLTLAVHQASIEQDLGQMSHRNFSVVAAHSDSMFLHSILVLAHLHRPVLTLPRPNCSTHLLHRSLSKPTV